MKRLRTKDLLTVTDLDKDEIYKIFALTKMLKRKNSRLLQGKALGMIFEKASTRTRVSFEVGMFQLGGYALFLSSNDIQLKRGETVQDTARVLSRYIDGIMIRAYSHESVVIMAEYSSIPVINGLTDLLHPCQALSDFYTITEYRKKIENLKLGYIGDGNNVANSLLLLSSIMGANIVIASPEKYSVDKSIEERAKDLAKKSGSNIVLTADPDEAAKDADVLYTDVWVSMGEEKQKEKKNDIFKNYQINSKIVNLAKDDVIIMHCLPAHRGEEITDEVIDGEHSVVFDEAENRLHTQKAILTMLMG